MLIYKIFRDTEWAVLRDTGETDGAPIDVEDGYVHFSTAEQVVETATKYFSGVAGLWLLGLDSDALGEKVVWEPSRGGALFPHLYRKLTMDDVFWAKPLPVWGEGHVFPEQIDGFIDPSRDQFDRFKALDRDHPIEMLNLVRLRETVDYPEGHALAAAGRTGAEAYAAYGSETKPIFEGLGGSIVWRGRFETGLIGPAEELWDHVFVARYPSAHAFLAMVTDPDYRKAVVHRQAGVATSRLIRCAPVEPGAAFG